MVGLVSAILCVLLSIRTVSALVGRLDPCATPGSITKVHTLAYLPTPVSLGSRQPLKWILNRVLVQGRGFYIGLSFWPGGTIEDWGPVLNETTQQLGLQPCLNATQYINSTNVTHQDYLVSAAF